MEIKEKVLKVVSEHLGIAITEVTPEKTLVKDLGADSLDTVELVMCMEDEFNVEILDSDGEKIVTVQDAIDLCTRLHAEKNVT